MKKIACYFLCFAVLICGFSCKSAPDKKIAAPIVLVEVEVEVEEPEGGLDPFGQPLTAKEMALSSDANAARKRAMEAREEAQRLKANVAFRTEFDGANAEFDAGDKFYRAKGYNEAVAAYNDSAAQFMNAAVLAAERRRLAAEALRQAEATISESDKMIAEAEAEGTLLTP
jgi:hypothetical protein